MKDQNAQNLAETSENAVKLKKWIEPQIDVMSKEIVKKANSTYEDPSQYRLVS